MLEGFVPFDFSEGMPYVSITRNGLTFNQSVVKKLGCPAYVVFLINEETKQIAIQACEAFYPNATAFYRPKKSGTMSVRWNSRDLMRNVTHLMQWDLDKESYKAEGLFLRDEQAIIFDLSKATAIN